MVDSITKLFLYCPLKKLLLNIFLILQFAFLITFSVDALTASIIPLLALSKLYSFIVLRQLFDIVLYNLTDFKIFSF